MSERDVKKREAVAALAEKTCFQVPFDGAAV